MSGYDIKKRFEEYLGKFWSESYGQIYPIAKELVDEGLATRAVEQTEGRPNRNVFTITDKGLEELKNWLSKPADPHKERLEVLLKLICGAHMSAESNIEVVQRFRNEWMSHIETYAEIERVLRATYEGDAQLPYWMMAVDCGMHIAKAYISWSDETIEALRQMQELANADSQ
jgi:DNA-binding PadR family transcriptional regulator